jgi:hypothetical protein
MWETTKKPVKGDDWLKIGFLKCKDAFNCEAEWHMSAVTWGADFTSNLPGYECVTLLLLRKFQYQMAIGWLVSAELTR